MPKIDRSIVQGLSTADCETDDAKRSKLDALAAGYKPVPAEETPFFTGQAEGRNYADVEEIDFDAIHENASSLEWDSVINDDDAAEKKAKQRSARRAKAAARKAPDAAGQRASKGDEVRTNSETALEKTLTAARAAHAAEQPVKEKPSPARLAFDKAFSASYRAAYEFHAAHWPPPSRDDSAAYNEYWDRFNSDLAALKEADSSSDFLTWLLDAIYLAADFYD